MAIFEYPKTRRDEWYRFLLQRASSCQGPFEYPYYTVGTPGVGIEAYTPPTRAEDRECWAKWLDEEAQKMADQEHSSVTFNRIKPAAVADDVKPVPDGETAEVWDRMENVVSDIQNGRLKAQGRMRIRGALDKAEAPLTGRAKADAGLGRAIRFGGV